LPTVINPRFVGAFSQFTTARRLDMKVERERENRTWLPQAVPLRSSSAVAGMVEGRKKVLCIEDDSTIAAMVAEELADRSFEVTVAHDGHEGFVAILKIMPDLVLCDLSLPIMSGFEVLERLNALAPRLGRIPFVFLTALSDRESELRARRLGADDYVTKPIDFDMLETIINARLAGVARNEVWPKLAMLNDREIEALTWAARGKTSAEIAGLIGLSKRTVDFHLDNARTKLGAATRTEAAIKAAIGKLIEP
jgi:DNA-binding NarL/FixJ family response regulator